MAAESVGAVQAVAALVALGVPGPLLGPASGRRGSRSR
ncbi:putative membrane protein [Mycobacterium kansasii]|uniref:Putative membrane protein n=1 Tax=Mycobacterium kansasii TaxID=1768 RepID=A0A1V3XTL6_MYCKA|nr:putative membrane protein [Mycobacterium kansasii]